MDNWMPPAKTFTQDQPTTWSWIGELIAGQVALLLLTSFMIAMGPPPAAATDPIIAVYGGTNPATIDQAIESGVDMLFPSIHWYGEPDGLRNNIERARTHGIKVYPSLAVAYDGHGESHHEFARNHPQFWEKRQDGSSVNRGAAVNLSWGFAEVRDYKVRKITELVRRLGCDGIFLDYAWYFGNDSGYADVIVTEFRQAHGRDPFAIHVDDPQWLRFRADYLTQFVGDLRASLNDLDRNVKILLCVNPDPTECLRDNLQDWPTWIDRGDVDAVVTHTFEITPENLYRNIKTCQAVLQGRVPQIPLLACWEDTTDSPLRIRQATAWAIRMGCHGVAYNQSTALHRLDLWPAVSQMARCSREQLIREPMNLLANPGFERGLVEWAIGRGIGMNTAGGTTRSGNRALQVHMISTAAVRQRICAVLLQDHKHLVLSAWIETSKMPKRSSVILEHHMTCRDGSKETGRSRHSAIPASRWRQILHPIQVAHGKKLESMTISIHGSLDSGDYTDTGHLHVDDVGLYPKQDESREH